MTTLQEIARYLDEVLDIAGVPDYPNAVNGLQLSNSGRITKVAAAVDFSSRTVAAAASADADLLLVHHGMFWSGVRPLTGSSYDRLRKLLDADVAVYSSHLPLDRHPDFGNNVLLSAELGLMPSGEFASFKGKSIGVRGEAHVPTAELVRRARAFARQHGGDVVATGIEDHRITSRWAICTGAGASGETLEEAAATNVDTMIVGEGPHYTAVEAAELGIAMIYAGHYATETLGVMALAKHVAERFELEWMMVHAPTGL